MDVGGEPRCLPYQVNGLRELQVHLRGTTPEMFNQFARIKYEMLGREIYIHFDSGISYRITAISEIFTVRMLPTRT